LSTAEATELTGVGKKALAQYFTPGQRPAAAKALLGMLAEDQDPNQVNEGAGVSKVVYDNVVVDGNTAQLSADVTAWAKSFVRQSGWLAAVASHDPGRYVDLRVEIDNSRLVSIATELPATIPQSPNPSSSRSSGPTSPTQAVRVQSKFAFPNGYVKPTPLRLEPAE
jgi:hypothetical protein